MKKLFLFLSLLASVALFQSCEKETTIDNDDDKLEAPQIPHKSMFTIPTADLKSTDSDTLAAQTQGISYHNWAHAGLNVLAWNTVVAVHMAIPTAAFGLALNEQPEYIGDATFRWAYEYEAADILGGKTYDIVLTGQYINDTQEVLWTMTASEEGGFTDFVWYTGVVAIDFSAARFILNRHPEMPEAFISIAYQNDANTNDVTIRFTNVVPGSDDNGHYIEHRTLSEAPYNTTFDVYRGGSNFLEIRWNQPAGNGQVKHPAHFNDNNWHCWDTNQFDVDC